MTDKELDDLFQKQFSNHHMPVPSDMWERVNPQKDKRRRVTFLWWSVLGVAALFVLVGSAVWLYHTRPETTFISEKTTQTQAQGSAANNDSSISKEQNPTIAEGRSSGSESGSVSSQMVRADVGNNQQQSLTSRKNSRNHQLSSAANEQHPSGFDNTTNRLGITIQNGDISANNTETGKKENRNPGDVAVTPSANETIVSSSQLIDPAQRVDSTALAAVTSAKSEEKKAPSIKITKPRTTKTASLELMVAGYGNSRNVYASKAEEAGIVALGAMPTKEKVLMHSFSLSARIDKPISEHFSIKTGLQYLQTYQRVSYHYETVNQTTLVNSFNTNDTVRYARLQSQQPVVKGMYNSISVPILISYRTSGEKWNLGATAGVMLNLVSWYRGNVPDAGYKPAIPAAAAFRKNTGTALYAGLTVSRHIGNFQLFAEPHVQYNLSSITKKEVSFRQKITSYGIGIGIRKSIGK